MCGYVDFVFIMIKEFKYVYVKTLLYSDFNTVSFVCRMNADELGLRQREQGFVKSSA